MKKVFIILLVMVISIPVAAYLTDFGMKVYSESCRELTGLDAVDISAVTVTVKPYPGRTEELTDAEIREFVDILGTIVLYEEDISFYHTIYFGQECRFDITLADGRKAAVTASNPFVRINKTGFRTEYKPCERLSLFANELVKIDVNPYLPD